MGICSFLSICLTHDLRTSQLEGLIYWRLLWLRNQKVSTTKASCHWTWIHLVGSHIEHSCFLSVVQSSQRTSFSLPSHEKENQKYGTHFGFTKGNEFYTPIWDVQSLSLPLPRRFCFCADALSTHEKSHAMAHRTRILNQVSQHWKIQHFSTFSPFSHELLYSNQKILAHLSHDCLLQCVFCFRSRCRLNIPKQFLLLK